LLTAVALMSNALLEGVVVNRLTSYYSLEQPLLAKTPSNSVLLIRAAVVNNDPF
jgi:hypothetical protein